MFILYYVYYYTLFILCKNIIVQCLIFTQCLSYLMRHGMVLLAEISTAMAQFFCYVTLLLSFILKLVTTCYCLYYHVTLASFIS